MRFWEILQRESRQWCQDVLLGVLIPVMPGPALRAGPFPDLQVLDLRVLSLLL